MADLINVVEIVEQEPFIPVDKWVPNEEDKIFSHNTSSKKM